MLQQIFCININAQWQKIKNYVKSILKKIFFQKAF